MLKLDREMPNFLKFNEILVKFQLWREKPSKNFVCTYYAPAYLRTTENINGYYDKMNFEGKDVLTVVGTGDHIFEAILRGAKRVDGFDISMYAIMFYYLKEAAIKALSYTEYSNFIFGDKAAFNKSSYNKLRSYINPKALVFWDLVYSSENPREVILSRYFTWSAGVLLRVDRLSRVSSHLSKENFYILKEKLKTAEVRMFLENAVSLDDIVENHDYIIFSNITDYVNYEEFTKATERYMKKINVGGKLVIYVYSDPAKYKPQFEAEEIPNFSEVITGVKHPACNYVMSKKK